MWTAIFSAIGSLAGVIDSILGWFRERSIHDAGVRDERLRVADAEARFQRDSENVKPITPANVVDRLRDGGF